MDPSYNASFDSFGSGGQTISSDGGGVVLSGSQKEKGKKSWIIGIIVVVLMLTGALAFVLMPKNNADKTAKQMLNEYSNFLLYGTESNEEITETDWSFAIIYDKMLYEDYDETYFDSLISKYEAFKAVSLSELKEDGFESSDAYMLFAELTKNVGEYLTDSKIYKGNIQDNLEQAEDYSEKVINASSWLYLIVNGYGEKHEG